LLDEITRCEHEQIRGEMVLQSRNSMVKRRRDRQAWEFMGPVGIKNLPGTPKDIEVFYRGIEGSTVPYSCTCRTSHRAQSFDFRYEVIYV
jgi:hypothetical protein